MFLFDELLFADMVYCLLLPKLNIISVLTVCGTSDKIANPVKGEFTLGNILDILTSKLLRQIPFQVSQLLLSMLIPIQTKDKMAVNYHLVQNSYLLCLPQSKSWRIYPVYSSEPRGLKEVVCQNENDCTK